MSIASALVAAPASAPSLALLATVLSASLVGSLHCVGMCGPFVAVYSAAHPPAGSLSGRGRSGGKGVVHAGYHLGRGVTYVSLGAFGGAVGAAIDWAGEASGWVHAAAFLSGLLVIAWGLGVLFPRLSWNSPLAGLLQRRLVQLGTKPRVFRASMLGVLTPLLPCGWLYAFVVTSAGTGSALSGALVMLTFWAGTVPALLGAGALCSRLSARLRSRLPVFTGLSLIAVGVFAVATRMTHPLPGPATGHEAGALGGEVAPCH